MSRTPRSVRVEADLVAELEELARQGLVPTTFSEQVHAGLRLLVAQAGQVRVRRSAALLAADEERAQQAFRDLHGQGR